MRKILITLLMMISSSVYALDKCNHYAPHDSLKEFIQCNMADIQIMKQKNIDSINENLNHKTTKNFYEMMNTSLDRKLSRRAELIEALDAKAINEKKAMSIFENMINLEQESDAKFLADQERSSNQYFADQERRDAEILSRKDNPPAKDLDVTCEKTYYGDGVRCRQR